MTAQSIFFAWNVGAPTMAWWALAAAVPILIHLWNRRKYKETTWAAMTYLLAAMQKHARRIRKRGKAGRRKVQCSDKEGSHLATGHVGVWAELGVPF